MSIAKSKKDYSKDPKVRVLPSLWVEIKGLSQDHPVLSGNQIANMCMLRGIEQVRKELKAK